MAITLNRCVLVGLGGTGVRALTHIKREFLRNFDRIPSFVQLVGFDTDRASKEALPLEGEMISLAQPEFMKLEAVELKRLISETPEIGAWAPMDKMSMRDVWAGAGQRRPSGRVALFNSAPGVYSRLERARNRVIEFSPGAEEGPFRVSNDPTVHVFIVSSLAGGTGSGMLLDIAHFCRDFLERRDRIHGFLVLSGAFYNIPLNKFVQPNTYGALKELNYWMGKDEPKEVNYPGGLTVTWGGEEHRPFNFLYLLDNKNKEGLLIEDLDTVLNFIARAMFMAMAVQSGEEVQGGGALSLWENLEGILDAATEFPKGERPKYIGVGMANLEIPVEKTIISAAYETSLNFIDELLSSTEDVQLDEFIHDQEMDGEHLMGSLIPEQSTIIEGPEPDIHRKDPSAVRNWRDTQIRKFEQEYRNMASQYGESYLEQLEKLKKSIHIRIKETLACDKAVGNVKGFLESLVSYFDQEQTKLEAERDQERQERQEIDYPEEELERAYHGGGFTPKKRRVQRVISKFRGNMKREVASVYEIERRNAATDLFGALKEYTRSYLNKLSELERLLGMAKHVIRVEFDRLKAKHDLEDVFSERLGEESLAKDIEDVRYMIDTEFITQEWSEQCSELISQQGEDDVTILGWDRLRPEALAEWLVNTMQKRYSTIGEYTIEDTLETLASNDLKAETGIVDAAQNFVNRAIPFWRYDKDPGAEAGIKEVLIFGLPHREGGTETSYFRNQVQEKLDMGKAPESGIYYALTWENYRLRALKIELPLALYTLRPVKDCRKEYLALEGNPGVKFTAHIHKDWVGPDSLPDIPE